MADIIDYVRKYGDDPYEERPFCTADAFVFACLGFVRFEDCNIVPSYKEPDKKTFIKDIPEEHIDKICANETYGPGTIELVKEIRHRNRYKDISMQYEFNIVDDVLIEQIYAITLNIPTVGYFILFRGTDGTTIGWSENFRATINNVSAAQLDAVEYLNIVHNLIGDVPFMLGGHSKGGTLTLYSSIFVQKDIQDLISKAYFFEGPGLPFKFFDRQEYLRVKDRIISIVPKASIIGELFYTPKNPLVVFCEGDSVMQHDQFHWTTKDADLNYVKERDPETRALHRASKLWLQEGKKKDFENLIKIVMMLTYAEDKENYISLKMDFHKFLKRYKHIREEFNLKERIRFYIFAYSMYRIYRKSAKYYKKKDKENNRPTK